MVVWIALGVLAVVGGVAIADLYRRYLGLEVNRIRQELEQHRAELRRDFAAAIEDVADIGTTIERHRRKADAALAQDRRSARKRGEQPAEETDEPQKPVTVEDELDAIRRRARMRGIG